MANLSAMKTKIAYLVSFAIIGTLIFFIYRSYSNENNSMVQLHASAHLEGHHIVIANQDSFDYLNMQLTVNEYYKITGYNLKSDETCSIGQVEFFLNPRRRMPLNVKPVKLSIWCNLYNGKKGYFTADLK
ncbi:hypothetical protein CLV93_10484 [Prolixibacter denitrificans]|uniref:Uncharacterized protein n=2 Tax=Prolixibacter denitrificans TaxID=1541063 RepID=A0A2P8CDV1_9BACT|nr:hypothetical protein CLV93_10484 [Prolixibacter denitrificans]GET21963.1 hypothetical protein JCM18694_22090 [Prolixibacter denitrificans]